VYTVKVFRKICNFKILAQGCVLLFGVFDEPKDGEILLSRRGSYLQTNRSLTLSYPKVNQFWKL